SYKGSRPFQMADIMGIGGSSKTLARNPDGSVKKDKKGNDVYITEGFTTFKGQYDNDKFTNTLVGKTGSADLAITFGGMLSTTEGNIYFAALTAPKAYEGIYTSPARSYIRDLVAMLAKQYELDPFEYTNLGLMNAIDKEATLVEEIPNLAAPMNLSLK
ncbi:MAG TPA: hypothetical protein VGE46_02670, partial [Bdellovibrio sp.]